QRPQAGRRRVSPHALRRGRSQPESVDRQDTADARGPFEDDRRHPGADGVGKEVAPASRTAAEAKLVTKSKLTKRKLTKKKPSNPKKPRGTKPRARRRTKPGLKRAGRGAPEVEGENATGALLRELSEPPAVSPADTGGDVDADWQRAQSSGEETVGGSVATP